MRRVRDHINRNLGDPDLSPERIARAQRISVRYLHRLFEGEGTTVGQLIRQRRLEECGRELGRRGGTAPPCPPSPRGGASSARRTSAGPSAPPTASPP
ncbi:hypothetical protein O1L60_34535 [Streptomyces diastatochromogenes]|nr:hypothetical protein [Streptomyces diastatochromogenes]